ncbi:MAG: pyruvate, phosphate dikinase, partial [Desulfobacterales bacterium]|nr:pyruvate, phosphate dikinase [Desulfobacterales bacterium]
TFLKELSHPYKNWLFIVKEARGYSLDYFHLLKNHPAGPEAGALYVGVFADAIKNAPRVQVKADAVDNLLLYLQKMIREAGQEIGRFLPTILDAFDLINSFQGASFFLFVKSFYQIKGLMESLIDAVDDPGLDLARAVQLLSRYYRESFAYWLNQSDPLNWFLEKVGKIDDPSLAYDIFTEISHERINEWKERLAHIESAGDAPPISRETIRELTTLPGYNQIVEIYRRTPHRLLKARGEDGEGAYWKALFLFHIMSISGLSVIHEEALRDINRTMTWIIANEHYRDIQKLIRKTFSILKVRTRKFPGASLNCVLNMGKGVYKTDDGDLINFFIDSMIDLGFQAPMIDGVGADWQIRANQAHLQNIRTWMELIEQKPSWSIRLLSSLIIHLALHGVFIRDTDLFPRDITRFLNSGVEPVYNLAKQLCRFFPVYFNAIGAEGELREVSTNVDELARRRDPLIHFLRKQSHVESSNRTLALMEATLTFWADGDKERIKPFTPPDIHGEIDADGPYVKGVHAVMTHLKKHGLAPPRDLLKIDAKKLKELTESAEGASEDDRERVRLAAKFYQLLHQKYSNDYTELDQYLNQVKSDVFPDFISLREALEEPETKKKMHILLDYLAALKEIIVSPRAYEIREDIYQKRHFAVDIPSMYGSYHEMKFDALGLTFRIESLVNVLFEELVESIDLSLITKATFYQIYARLRLFNKALKLDGVTSIEMERQLDFLRHSLDVRGFSFTQYLDIFKGFTQAVKNIINDHFHNIHEENLKRILARVRVDWILPKYLPRKGTVDGDELNHRVSEIFFRERIAFALGLQQLDLLLSRIL